MKKRKRARVRVGTDEHGKALYKWASAYTTTDLEKEKERIRREYIPHQTQSRSSSPVNPPASSAHAGTKIPKHAKKPAKPVLTFRRYAQTWYELYKAPHIRRSTRDTYHNALDVHILPTFGDWPVTDITADDLQRFILHYDNASRSLIDKIMMTLRQIFQSAYEDEIISRNPVNKMVPPDGTVNERLPLSMADVSTLTSAASSHPFGIIPLLLLYTGLRRGEALGLRWQDIDGDMLHVRRAVNYHGNNTAVVAETKTKAAHRVVPLSPLLCSLIYAARETSESHGYIIGGGTSPMPYSTFKRRWDVLQRDIPVLQNVTPHRLRHTYLMLLRRAGVDPATQQYLMGHSDYETTVNTYTHIDNTDVLEARNRISNVLPTLLPQVL